MLVVVLIVAISFVMLRVVNTLDQNARKKYIPREELMQKYVQPDKYVPWSYKKRMRYYDREQSIHRKPMPSQRTYVSYIETGYIHRRS